MSTSRPLGHESLQRVYLPLYKVIDTPFLIQGDDLVFDGTIIHSLNQILALPCDLYISLPTVDEMR